MRKLLLASASAVVIAGAANAADMPMKAPAPPPAAFSWTGCYVGGHVGWGWGRSTFRDHSTENIVATNPSGTSVNISQGLIDSFSHQRTAGVDQSGGIFGGQLGCDYQ